MPGSCHVDTFVLDRLPHPDQQPDFINLERLAYPVHLNATVELVDRRVEAGDGDRVAVLAPGVRWSYAELAAMIDRMAHALTGPLGMVPGNRVMLRSANNPTMVALYLAVIKAGGIVVATMPLLRAHELVQILDKAAISLVLCDAGLVDEMKLGLDRAAHTAQLVTWTGIACGELGGLLGPEIPFTAALSRADDPCLLGFTSGTTGLPKATIHYHRDLLVICDCYARDVLRATPEDRFIGSPPLAFTFGLGGLVLFPFRIGATAILLEKAGPLDLASGIAEHHATICFTSPTAYRAMLGGKAIGHDLSSLRKCVSAGETLPKPIYDAWLAATGLQLMDGIGATEMLHIFIGAREDEIRPGATGKPLPGYEARIVDPVGQEVPRGVPGRLAVRGPIGCRYLDDPRQAVYVEAGWNITGDTYVEDAEGYFWFQARNDDMIVSSGYNIAGPEVEAALLAHPAVLEAGVVGAPDPERGRIVKAYVVLANPLIANPALIEALQVHVKQAIAPYKYPRAIEFVDELPKTQSGKLQRIALRHIAERKGEQA